MPMGLAALRSVLITILTVVLFLMTRSARSARIHLRSSDGASSISATCHNYTSVKCQPYLNTRRIRNICSVPSLTAPRATDVSTSSTIDVATMKAVWLDVSYTSVRCRVVPRRQRQRGLWHFR
jgi:hypothetical protein